MSFRVSIVIPVFNGERYLAAAIESVLSQSYEGLEVIVVDDGSTDGSAAIADRYQDRCRVIHQANAGQSAALEAGWSAAEGALLGYLSADDLLKPGAVAALSGALAERPACVLAYPDYDVIDANDTVLKTVTPPDFTRAALYGRLHCLPGPGALFRREAYAKAGPWRRDLRQIPDLEFYLRLGLYGDFYRVPQSLAAFRRHDGSTTYSPVRLANAYEPQRAVEALLQQAGLPADVASHRRAMLASAHYLSAHMHGQSRRPLRAMVELARAIGYEPSSVLSVRCLAAIRVIVKGRA